MNGESNESANLEDSCILSRYRVVCVKLVPVSSLQVSYATVWYYNAGFELENV
jgi:hypothetical protein